MEGISVLKAKIVYKQFNLLRENNISRITFLLFMSFDLSHIIHITPAISLQLCNAYGKNLLQMLEICCYLLQ